MWIIYKNSPGGVILRGKCRDKTTGNGKTGMAFNTAGLIIGTIADNEAVSTAYTVAAGSIQTIANLGTFAAPSVSPPSCRFREVDATNHPGLYEVQLATARLAVTNAKNLIVSVSGVANLLDMDGLIPLWDATRDPYAAMGDTPGTSTLVNVRIPSPIADLPTSVNAIVLQLWRDLYSGGAGNFDIPGTPGFSMKNAPYRKGVAVGTFYFLMISNTDHQTPKTGLGSGVLCQRSLDSAALANCSNNGTAIEIGFGLYAISLTSSDMNGNAIAFRFSGTGADDAFISIVTSP